MNHCSFLPTTAAMTMAQFLQTSGPEAQLVLSDLDGCLISGAVVLPHVQELVARAGDRLWIITNNSADTSVSLQKRLAALGLEVCASRILLAGETALRALARVYPGAEVALFASPALWALAQELGLKPHDGARGAGVIFLARDPAFSLGDLTRLMRLAHHGTPLWVANPDLTHPADDGTPVPETGALFAALKAGVPDIHPRMEGKPSPAMLTLALQATGTAPQRAVFLGDNPGTDGAAARAAGVPFVLLHRPGAAPTEI